jgi:hypothetical protein
MISTTKGKFKKKKDEESEKSIYRIIAKRKQNPPARAQSQDSHKPNPQGAKFPFGKSIFLSFFLFAIEKERRSPPFSPPSLKNTPVGCFSISDSSTLKSPQN